MLRFLADEDFNNYILRGLRLRNPAIDLVRVQDVELSAAKDPVVLEWAAQEERIVLTHDVNTMTKHAYDRVREGKRMPGVFEVNRYEAIGAVIDDLLILAECSIEDEWEGQVRYIPFR